LFLSSSSSACCNLFISFNLTLACSVSLKPSQHIMALKSFPSSSITSTYFSLLAFYQSQQAPVAILLFLPFPLLFSNQWPLGLFAVPWATLQFKESTIENLPEFLTVVLKLTSFSLVHTGRHCLFWPSIKCLLASYLGMNTPAILFTGITAAIHFFQSKSQWKVQKLNPLPFAHRLIQFMAQHSFNVLTLYTLQMADHVLNL